MISAEPKEVILIDIKCTFVLKVNVKRIYTFYPFCPDLRRLLHEFIVGRRSLGHFKILKGFSGFLNLENVLSPEG